MRTLTCALLLMAFAGFAVAANTPAELKSIQEVSDAFIKAAVDNDFDAFKEKVSTKRLDEYTKNEINCPLARWWECARKDVDKDSAKWEFVSVKTNMPATVVFNYTRTMASGVSAVTIELVKEGDKWLVDAAGGTF